MRPSIMIAGHFLGKAGGIRGTTTRGRHADRQRVEQDVIEKFQSVL